MNKMLWVSLAVTVGLVGCGDQESEKKEPNQAATQTQTITATDQAAPANRISENTTVTAASTNLTAAVAQAAAPKPVEFDPAAKYKAACAACHGVSAQGQGTFPKLAGRNADALGVLLADYKAGKAKGPQSAMMMPIAAKLSTEEIKALAGYLSALK